MLAGLGKSSDTEFLLERLLQVAPLDLFFRAERMNHFIFTREYERGIAEVERTREFAPEFVDLGIVGLYMLLGRPEDAARELLAFYARGGAAFDPLREAFERGSEEGGVAGRVAGRERPDDPGGDAGRVRPREPDCGSIRHHRGD
jgi:hypothetical protein